MSPLRLLVAAVAALLPSLAFAHHGQDFLLLESPGIPHAGNVYLIANAHAVLDSNAEEDGGFEPSLLFGVSPRFAFELHAHTEKPAGEDWLVESTAVAAHLLLSDPARHHGPKVGLGVEYEFARDHDEPDRVEARMAVETRRGAETFGANLIASHATDGRDDFGAGLAWRHATGGAWSLGAEAQGSFDHAEGTQLLAGAYFEHEQSWALKLGLGAEREAEGGYSPVAHVGLVLRLHGG
jgi:hypothetical protein